MRQNKLRSAKLGTGSNDHRPGHPNLWQACFTSPKHLPWLAIVAIGLMFSVDFLIAAQQQRLLEVTVTRHIMAALQEDADRPIDRSLRAH